MARLPGTLEGMISPEICVVMAAASRIMPAASMQLKPAHMAVAPVSAPMTGANFAAGGLEQVGGLVEQRAAGRGRHLRPGREGCGCGVGRAPGVLDAAGRRARGDLAGHRIEPVEGGAAGGLGVGIADHAG